MATPDPVAQPEPTKVAMPVYVPEGYVLRRTIERRPAAAPAPRRRSGSFVLGIALTLVAGMLVGFLGGFAVARRTSDASVTVTVHESPQP